LLMSRNNPFGGPPDAVHHSPHPRSSGQVRGEGLDQDAESGEFKVSELPINQIICGDCIRVLNTLPDNSIDLIVTDPPYNIGIDEWDNIKNYYDWLVGIFKECERVLKENGTLWFFHMSFEALVEIHTRLIKQTSFRHKQLIIINKGIGSVAGRCNTEVLRSFPRATEYLQFYTFEDVTGAKRLSDTYAKKNPMAEYLREEFNKAGVSERELAKLFPSKTGGFTGCVCNWLLGYNFPLKEQYEKMKKYLNNEYLRKEYEDIRKEYEDQRYTFDLPLNVTDVWNINFYKDWVDGHLTVKPIGLIRRIINAASNKGDIILDPFLGSGTTAVVCRLLNRNYIGIEISEEYCKIAEARLKNIPQRLETFGGAAT